MTIEEVKERIENDNRLSPVALVEVTDISGGCGASFDVLIVSDAFIGQSLLNRHRAVHAALEREGMVELHALRLRAVTRQQHIDRTTMTIDTETS